MSDTHQIDQIALISAISTELCRQIPDLTADHRYNTIIEAANLIVKEFARKPVVGLKGVGLNAWLASDDVGASSLYMAGMLTGGCIAKHAYPRDVDDFGRCVRMIEAVYQEGAKVPLDPMLNCGPYWAMVTTNWLSWETMYKAEKFAELHEAMREAYAAVDSGN